MIDNLLEILSGFGYPVYKQGAMSDDEVYPETFLTFWNNDSPIHSYYDNIEYGTTWEFDVNVYSSDAGLTYSVLDNIRTALKAANWICPDKGHDVYSDENTHTGRGMEVYFLEV